MDAPSVSGSVVAGTRVLLLEQGLWPKVRDAFLAAHGAQCGWIDESLGERWLDAGCYVQLIEAVRVVVGDVSLREVGKQRFARATEGGTLAPIVRSWARTFRHDPAELVRATPHLWGGGTRNLGRLRLVEHDASHARFVFDTRAPVFLEARAWHTYLEGWAEGLIELARPVDAVPPRVDVKIGLGPDGLVELRYAWS